MRGCTFPDSLTSRFSLLPTEPSFFVDELMIQSDYSHKSVTNKNQYQLTTIWRGCLPLLIFAVLLARRSLRCTLLSFDPANANLPPYDSKILVGINRWARDKPLEDLQAMRQSHRRFMFYYYFAVDVYGASDRRIQLPPCVLAAVRHRYPQRLVDNDYIGHRDEWMVYFISIFMVWKCWIM